MSTLIVYILCTLVILQSVTVFYLYARLRNANSLIAEGVELLTYARGLIEKKNTELTESRNFRTRHNGGGCDVFGPETLSEQGVQEFFDSSMKFHANDTYYTTADE